MFIASFGGTHSENTKKKMCVNFSMCMSGSYQQRYPFKSHSGKYRKISACHFVAR